MNYLCSNTMQANKTKFEKRHFFLFQRSSYSVLFFSVLLMIAGFPAKVYLQGFSRKDFSYNCRPRPSGNFTTGAFMSQKEPCNL